MIPKKKRGRPPKVRYPIPSEIEFPASHLPEDAIKELQLTYKLLKEIMGLTKLRPLVEKPDELLYGLYDYYHIIEKPMWFLEISRKYAEKEYQSAVEVISDMRLVLENCYRFWGKKHRFVKQALRAEKMVAKHVVEFPPELKAKCCLALYDSEDALSMESDSMTQQYSFMTEEYTSKILQNLERKPITTKMGATVEEMREWEVEVLGGKKLSRQINIVSELAEIGQFLLMAREFLCLKPISQYEIERMLLISKESTTLATIMTSFLCPTTMRGALFFKPIMVYDVWVSLLQKKLDSWFNAYAKSNNRMQIFLKYGVEPSFFGNVGNVNPLSETPFYELSLLKKASILKALCSSMFHSNKKIEEYFNLVDEESLKSRLLYSDSKYNYVSLFSPEIRVYRSSKLCLDIDETIETVYPRYFNYYPRVEEPQGSQDSFTRKQKFCLLAHDTESLTNLSQLFASKRRSRTAINRLLAEEKNRELSLIGLRALYNQWNKAIHKEPASIEISTNYWIIKVVNNPTGNDTENGDSLQTEINAPQSKELGRRIMKRKYPLEDHEDTFSSHDEREKPNEEDVSDWEDGNIRRSRRNKKVGGLPRFFNDKYMKFNNASCDESDYGKTGVKDKPGNILAGTKKPRKKRAVKNPSDQPPKRNSKLNRKINNENRLMNLTTVKDTILGNFSRSHEEQYMPPNEVVNPIQTTPQDDKHGKITLCSQPFGSSKNDLFDLGGWDFGLQGIPHCAPLKPIESISLPEEGEKKLLELGAFKGYPELPKNNLKNTIEIKPHKPNIVKPLIPPMSQNRIPYQKMNTSMPLDKSNLMIFPSMTGKSWIPPPHPSTSRIVNRVFVQRPVEELSRPKLMAGVVPAASRDTMLLKSGVPRIRIPVPHSHAIPQPNLLVKRKVNLPARPLSIPILKNQEVPVFESQAWAKHAALRTVLYIPSGTPTITIPSGSGSHGGISTILASGKNVCRL